MKIEIKSRFSLQILFSHECEDNSVAITLAAAINAKANLRSADLYGADLRSANLYGANLRSANLRSADLYGADLYGADLRSANLYGADLRSANLYGADLGDANLYGANLRSADLYGADLGDADLRSANLYGADLRSANLYGANLYGANLRSANLGDADLGDAGKLTGDRPYFAVGPIGSRQDVLAAFLTEKGVFLRAGCFFGTVEEFKGKLQDEHGDNVHAIEYRAALVLVEAHYNAWPPSSPNKPDLIPTCEGTAAGSPYGGRLAT
jgi:hypothetical protein